MSLKTSKRGAIPPFIVMDVMRAAYQREVAGNHVLHMEVGQPGTAAPQPVLDAAKAALDGNRIGYTGAFGLPELRRRLSDHYREFYGADVAEERIVVTTGSSGAFVLSFLGLFDPGDRVALASPGYPAYRNILKALDVEPIDLLVGPETNYQPSPELLERIEGRLDGLIIASPSNPTGTMLTAAEMEALAEYCRDRGIRLISDEIYHGISYGARAETALAFNDDAIVINSFSKYFSMTGWRLGWMVVPVCRKTCSYRHRPCRSWPLLQRLIVVNNWMAMLPITRATDHFCWIGCRRPVLTGCRTPTELSTCMQMSQR